MTLPESADATLRAGVARAIVTPPVGTRLNGSLRDGESRAVDRELTVTALALVSGDTRVVLLACDAVAISPEEAADLRSAVADRAGCRSDDVFVNVSHSHATPSPPSIQEVDAESDAAGYALALRYHADLVAKAAGAAQLAVDRAVPAVVGYGTGTVDIGVNRREVGPDGTLILGENADGVTDPTVGVVRVDTTDGAPIATIVHYSCHPDVLGPKSELISPDYVGAARDVVEKVTGSTMLFLQGCAGDIDPCCGIVVGDDGVRESDRLGTELGCEAARVYQRLAPSRVRDRRVYWRSSTSDSSVTGWLYKDAELTPAALRSVSRTVTLPLRELPSIEDATRQLDAAAEEYEKAQAAATALSDVLRARRRHRWAQLQLDAARAGGPTALDVEVHVVRIGGLALVGLPAEVFVEIGTQIAAASPFDLTLVSGYTNGIYFYVPTAAAFAQGGYEIDSHQNYLRPAGPTPEWEPRLVDAATDVLTSAHH